MKKKSPKNAALAVLHGAHAASAAERLNQALQAAGAAKALRFSAAPAAGAQWEAWLDGGAALSPAPGAQPLLNLEDAALAVGSADLAQEPLWFSRRDPRRVLGALWDGMQGAHLSAGAEELVVAGTGQILILPYLPASDPEAQGLHEHCSLLLALVGSLAGLGAEPLCSALEALRKQSELWPASGASSPLAQRAA